MDTNDEVGCARMRVLVPRFASIIPLVSKCTYTHTRRVFPATSSWHSLLLIADIASFKDQLRKWSISSEINPPFLPNSIARWHYETWKAKTVFLHVSLSDAIPSSPEVIEVEL